MEKAAQNLELILKYFSDLTPHQVEQLAALDGLYKEWNSKINIISRKDINSLYEKHVLHSLSIAATNHFEPGSEILDIGTGGGFPGIPLAIVFPEVKFLLVDSIGKKLKVVDEIKLAIGLHNISTQHTRVEAIKKMKFDYTISRAVAPLKDLWSWSKPLLKKRTAKYADSSMLQPDEIPGLICLKGGDLSQEIAASNTNPVITPVYTLFPESFFKDKFVVSVGSGQ